MKISFASFGPMRLFTILLMTHLTDGVWAADRPNVVIFLADDLGYADLGAQQLEQDVRTPNLDLMAANGVRCTAGYTTAPQCSPSRAGLMTGRYQQRFGIDTIPDMPLPAEAVTIAERLKPAGYVSGMVGKWHLDPNRTCKKWISAHLPTAAINANGEANIPQAMLLPYFPAAQGFDDFFMGEMNSYWANYDLTGKDTANGPQRISFKDAWRIDLQTDAALAFIDRHHEQPFVLYVGFYGPHVPLDAPKEWLDRFPGEMPERRRTALAMIAGIDAGIGRIQARLAHYGLTQKTLSVFTSDNGAPLKMTKEDTMPIGLSAAVWDGSLNTPLNGEKGMLTEGGVRVPYLMQWPGTLPAGMVYAEPVSTLDIVATANAAAGLAPDPQLDGVNLIPYVTGAVQAAPHQALFWRFWQQAAIRVGQWKYLKAGPDREFLFDLTADVGENINVIGKHPEIAKDLKAQLTAWAGDKIPAGLPQPKLNDEEKHWYEYYYKE